MTIVWPLLDRSQAHILAREKKEAEAKRKGLEIGNVDPSAESKWATRVVGNNLASPLQELHKKARKVREWGFSLRRPFAGWSIAGGGRPILPLF